MADVKKAGVSDGMSFPFQSRRAVVTIGKCKKRKFLTTSIYLVHSVKFKFKIYSPYGACVADAYMFIHFSLK